MVSHNQDPGVWFKVNFGMELREIFSETRYFEQLGFKIPEQVLVMAVLQDKFIR